MSMIEIDPHLFIKCRLCLVESGKYQIVPAIRDQISYCFGINVEPFDGLPQLICKICQIILCEYSKTKQKFIQKQEELKKRKPENNLTKAALVKSESSKRQNENNDRVKANTKKRKRLLSSSSDETNSNHSEAKTESCVASKRRNENNDKVKANTKKSKRLLSTSSETNSNHAAEDIKKTASEGENINWKAKYQRTFTCTVCNATWLNRKVFHCHQAIHKTLKSQYVDIFNKYCVVEMPKIDDKPNITGSTNKVVYSKNKIIAKCTADYYVAYKYKDKNIKREEHNNADECPDSSFQSNIARHSRVRRVTSNSSTETVVLENNTNSATDVDCISIDDSDSPDDKFKTKEKRKASEKTVNIDTVEATNMISKLINVSHLKYAKSHEMIDKSTLQQLNRKIISIGRQIINKTGFNSNRLMKYMEHLNLNVIWLSRSPLSVTNSSNYFKIIPRTRYANEKSCNDFEGYKKKYVKQNRKLEATLEQELTEEESETESTDGRLDGSSVEKTVMAQLRKVNQDVIVSSTGKSNGHAELDSAINRILLNANPVANPKRLSKITSKFTGEKVHKQIKKGAKSMPTLEVSPEELSSEVITNHENNMPVITYTRSLATSDSNEKPNNDNVEPSPATSNGENAKPSTAPRIKVKSVSELMSKETLNRMKEPAAGTPDQQLNNAMHTPYAFVSPQTASVSNTVSLGEEYVILDTVELPNTKTSSPFSYFRMLLQVHNLSLLDTEAILSQDFNCLIRFKVRYNHENKDHPVILCLSLLCLNNIFCIKIKDRNDDNINMSKISANWQWEILKIYQGDVVPKVLANAQKASPEVYINTNRFICLLKSINYVPK